MILCWNMHEPISHYTFVWPIEHRKFLCPVSTITQQDRAPTRRLPWLSAGIQTRQIHAIEMGLELLENTKDDPRLAAKLFHKIGGVYIRSGQYDVQIYLRRAFLKTPSLTMIRV